MIMASKVLINVNPVSCDSLFFLFFFFTLSRRIVKIRPLQSACMFSSTQPSACLSILICSYARLLTLSTDHTHLQSPACLLTLLSLHAPFPSQLSLWITRSPLPKDGSLLLCRHSLFSDLQLLPPVSDIIYSLKLKLDNEPFEFSLFWGHFVF